MMEFWAAVSFVFSPMTFIILSMILLIYSVKFPQNKSLRVIIFSLIITFALTEMLKQFFMVPRPCDPCPYLLACSCPSDFSFPSGHASVISAAVFSVIMATRRKEYLPLLLLIPLVSASRLYLAVHTLPDVLAGIALGFTVPLFVNKILRKYL